MKKEAILIILLLLCSYVDAQRYRMSNGESSFEISIGPSSLMIGDIGEPLNDKYFFDFNSPYHDSLKLINSSISLGFHQEINDKLSYKLSIHSSSYERPKPDENRNYFLSNVFEFTARAEYNLFRIIAPRESVLYLHAGVGVLYSSSVVRPSTVVATEPLPITAPVIPAGLGYRLYLTPKFKLGVDVNMHYVLNDLVEGRGVPLITTGFWPNDILFNVGVSAAYVVFHGNKQQDRCRCEWY